MGTVKQKGDPLTIINFNWVLVTTKKWHAWPVGARRSYCGTVTVDDLSTTPAVAIAPQLPEGAVVCGSCAPHAGLSVPIKKKGQRKLNTQGAAWLGYLRRHLVRVGARAAERELRAVAAHLANVGPTTDAAALAVFEQIRALLLTPRRHRTINGVTVMKITRLREAVKALPPETKALHHLAEALRTWRRITGRDVKGEKFRPDTVIKAMLEVPAPEAYIEYAHSKGLSPLALMFHPNTIKNCRTHSAVRGIFGGSVEYAQHTADQLAAQIIED